MSILFNIDIVNPEQSFLSKDNVFEVVIPAVEGEIGILKDHIPIISFSVSYTHLTLPTTPYV